MGTDLRILRMEKVFDFCLLVNWLAVTQILFRLCSRLLLHFTVEVSGTTQNYHRKMDEGDNLSVNSSPFSEVADRVRKLGWGGYHQKEGSLSELHVKGRQSVALAPSGHAGHLFGPIFSSKMAYDLGNTLFYFMS